MAVVFTVLMVMAGIYALFKWPIPTLAVLGVLIVIGKSGENKNGGTAPTTAPPQAKPKAPSSPIKPQAVRPTVQAQPKAPEVRKAYTAPSMKELLYPAEVPTFAELAEEKHKDPRALIYTIANLDPERKRPFAEDDISYLDENIKARGGNAAGLLFWACPAGAGFTFWRCRMPKRSEKRDTAKAEYIAKKKKGEEVSLRALAGELGVSYQTLRNWKAADKWEEALPKKKRGGQPGNQNSKGKRNAAGSHDGAPPGNKNAEKDGAYSTVFFDMLSAEELKITESVPLGGREALEHEMKILKFREHKILAKIAEYESQPEDALFVSSLLDMRTPGGRGKDKKDGANQTMGMYSKDSAFSRVLKLQEALYKVQGRIAKIADSLRALEESDRRMALEKQRLEILRMRATGAVDVPDPDGTAADDLDAPLEEDTEE